MRIDELFVGYEHAHGYFEIKRSSENGKKEGKALTVKEPLTADKWKAHLEGAGAGIGVIPLLSDDTVRWGCIDIDVNTIDHNALERQARELSLPLVIARSKSGGAHAFLFLSECAPSNVVRDKLEGWAAALGYGGCEVFPKQTSRYNEHDLGNWLNMPYYVSERTTRYAIKDGEPLSLSEFEEYATACAITNEQLADIHVHAPYQSSRDDPNGDAGSFPEGPPCLQILERKGGFPEGTRNDGMYNVAIYLKKRNPDNWANEFADYNKTMCDPPLSNSEIQTLIKSVSRKDYDYSCKKAPICNFCHRRECRTREYGVGETAEGGGKPEIGHLVKYEGDPVIWFAEVEGHRIMLTTEELLNQNLLKRKVAEALNRVITSLPQPRWDKYLDGKMSQCDVVEVPEDASPKGQFYLLVEQYCTGMAQATSKEELAHRLTPFNTGEGYVWFRSRGLLDYLNNHGFKYKSEHHVWQMLRELGAETKFVNVKGKGFNVWILPEFATAQEDAPIPDFGGEEF